MERLADDRTKRLMIYISKVLKLIKNDPGYQGRIDHVTTMW